MRAISYHAPENLEKSKSFAGGGALQFCAAERAVRDRSKLAEEGIVLGWGHHGVAKKRQKALRGEPLFSQLEFTGSLGEGNCL